MLDDMTAMSFETEADFNQASGIPDTQAVAPTAPTPEQLPEEQKTPEVVEEAPVQPVAQGQRESDAAYNFRLIRERQEEAERRSYQLQRELEEERAKQKASTQKKLDPLDDDDFSTGAHHKQTLEELNALKAQFEYMQVQQNLRTKYPDFDMVVTEKNLEEFAKRKPLKWSQIADDQNVYRKQAAAYEELKELGILNGDPYKAEKAAIKNNNARPRSAATISAPSVESPLSQANAFANGELSEAKRRANFRLMTERAEQETW